MKYMGCCWRESSRTNTPVMATLLTERYKNKGFLASSLLSLRRQERYFLNSPNAFRRPLEGISLSKDREEREGLPS